jgi:hypothetical protein
MLGERSGRLRLGQGTSRGPKLWRAEGRKTEEQFQDIVMDSRGPPRSAVSLPTDSAFSICPETSGKSVKTALMTNILRASAGGGAWSCEARDNFLSSFRGWDEPGNRSDRYGFRVVLAGILSSQPQAAKTKS